MTAAEKPKIGIYGFTGCAGDQLLIIHTEDEILNLFGATNIQSFVMASSNPIEEELDVVELVVLRVLAVEDVEELELVVLDVVESVEAVLLVLELELVVLDVVD